MKSKTLLLISFAAVFASCNEGARDNQDSSEIENSSRVECSQCPTFQPSQDTLEYVNELRTFLAEKCDLGLMTHPIAENYSEYPIGEFPADIFLDLFESDSLAASVGMITRIMQQVLTENEIDSYVYKFGLDANKHSHCVVLVKINSKLVVVDPYFNYTLYTEGGEPIGIIELIDLIGKKQTEQVQIQSPAVITDFLFNRKIAPSGVVELLNQTNCEPLQTSLIEIRDSTFKTNIQRCFECDIENTCVQVIKPFEARVTNDTQLESFMESFVLKLEAVWGEDNAMMVDDLIETAIYSQPNLGKRTRKPKR